MKKNIFGIGIGLCLILLFTIVFDFSGNFKTEAVNNKKAVQQTNVIDNSIFVGYYPSWNKRYGFTTDRVEYSKYDIINFAFIFPNADGTLDIPVDVKDQSADLILKAHNNGKKVVISVGGGTRSENFPKITANKKIKDKFINELKNYITKNNYDGVDIDWEFPTNSKEAGEYISLLKDIKKSLGNKKIVSTAIGINYQNINIEELSKTVDYVYIMAYDIEGGWNSYAGYNAPLLRNSKMPYEFSIDDFLKNKFYNKNIDRKKFIFGMPTYGRKFNVENPYDQTNSFSEYIRYADIEKENCSDNWDTESLVPYFKCGDYYVSYENIRSLEEKIKYAKKNGFGGTFIYAIGEDDSELIKELNTKVK